MEIRPYVVEQHFDSELVDIEVEIGFMETRLEKKDEEKRRLFKRNRTSPFSPYFLSNWWRSKLKEK